MGKCKNPTFQAGISLVSSIPPSITAYLAHKSRSPSQLTAGLHSGQDAISSQKSTTTHSFMPSRAKSCMGGIFKFGAINFSKIQQF